MMDNIGKENNALHKRLSASGKINFLSLIAARINLQWKRDGNFSTEYQHQQQQKRQKKDHDFTLTQQDNGKDSNGESQAIQMKNGEDSFCCNDNQTVRHLQLELEKVRQKCERLESENTQFRGRLVENDNKFDEIISSYEKVLEGKNKEIVEMMDAKQLCATFKQELGEKTEEINKLQDEKEEFQKEIKGLNQLIEKYEKQSELRNDDLSLKFELKGKQEEIEDLRRQLDEKSGFGLADLKEDKERSALENENLRLQNEISEMEGLFEEIQDQFDNKLKEKNNEVVEMMVEWMENHEVLSATQEENGKLKSENDCAKRDITKLTKELTAKQAEYVCRSNTLKKLEKDFEAKINEIKRLNKKINELTTKYDQKLKKNENEANQLEKSNDQMKDILQNAKHENEEMKKKLLEMECSLKGKEAEIELLLSDRNQIINFAVNLQKITSFPDNENFPLVIQLEEFTVYIKDKLRLMDWYVKTVDVLRQKGMQIDVPNPTPPPSRHSTANHKTIQVQRSSSS